MDTSALIDMHHCYPESTFPKMWENLANLVDSQRAVAPKQVSYEIVRSKFLIEWCEAHSAMFMPTTQDVWNKAYMIMQKFPVLASRDKFGRQADPFIIASAMGLKFAIDGSEPMIITQEDPTKRNNIPQVAKSFNIKSDKLDGLLAREGWQ